MWSPGRWETEFRIDSDLCPNSHKHSTMKLDLNSYLPAPDHVTSLNESTRNINQSPCARGPPSAIAFKESKSNGRSPATPPFLLSSLGCVHAVCLIHSWLSATAYINKRGKPLWRILVPKWSNLSSEIIVWNCLCQLPSFCSVLWDLLATEGKVPHSWAAPLGREFKWLTVRPVACGSLMWFATTQQSTLRIMESSVLAGSCCKHLTESILFASYRERRAEYASRFSGKTEAMTQDPMARKWKRLDLNIFALGFGSHTFHFLMMLPIGT